MRKIIQSIWIVINVFFAIGMIISAFGGYIHPDTFALTQIACLMFPAWTILTFVLLFINIRLNGKLALMHLAVLAICIKPILTICPLNVDRNNISPINAPTLTLLTYNTLNFHDNEGIYPNNTNRTMSTIISYDADIVCLQEVRWEAELYRNHVTQSQMDTLKRMYPYRLMYTRMGESILSKHPFREIKLSHPRWSSGDFKAYEVSLDSIRLTLFNCHLQSIRLSNDDKMLYHDITQLKEDLKSKNKISQVGRRLIDKLSTAFKVRAEQAQLLRHYINETKGNVIVAGDFNDVPLSYAYLTIKGEDLSDAYATCAIGPTITFNDNRFYFHIDHILYRGNLKAIDIKRGDIPSSDHYPLFTTFSIAPSR